MRRATQHPDVTEVLPDDPKDHERWRLERLEEWRRTIDAIKPEVLVYEVHQLRDRIGAVEGKMDSLRKALITFALTLATSAVVIALSFFLAFKK